MTNKIAVIAQGGNAKFLPPIMDWLKPRFDVREIDGSDSEKVREALSWADLTWVEWVQDVAVDVSRMARRGKLVMRLHSFEAYTSQPTQVMWQNVDALIVVAAHMTEILKLRIPDIETRTSVFVLPNGIDMDRFTIPASKIQTGKIAFVGQLRHTKNLPMVLQCFAAARAADPRQEPGLTLHIAGEYAGTELEIMELMLYLDHMTHAMGIADAVTFHGQIDDMPRWLVDKDALISASIRESFGYNIGEAMACGVRPAIHNFPGAGTLYPAELIFNTVAQCAEILTGTASDRQSLRNYALTHWPLKLQHATLGKLIGMMLG